MPLAVPSTPSPILLLGIFFAPLSTCSIPTFRIIGRGGEVGREQRERKYEQHEQAKAFMKFLMGRVI